MPTVSYIYVTDQHIRKTPVSVGTQNFGDELPDGTGYRIEGNQDNSFPRLISSANSYNEGAGVDLVINGGDIINNTNDGSIIENWAEYASWIDGTHLLSDGLNMDILYCFGHWDLGIIATGTSFANAFTGLAPTIPVGRDANMWWPDLVDDVADNSYCAYRFDKNGFMFIVLCNPFGSSVDMTTMGKNGTKTQEAWFEDQLVIAEILGMQVIVVTHVPLRTNDTSPINGAAAAIAYMVANQTIKPIVMQAHVHRYNEVIIEEGIRFYNFIGDTWGITDDDTDRFSHAIITVVSDAVWDGTTHQSNVKIEGFGYQSSRDFDKYFIG